MIRLALAVGFLAVFGIVAYAIVMLLVQHFNKKDNQDKNSNS
jgi:phage shock protein PspC (stress-responsive transcriptional regulator)